VQNRPIIVGFGPAGMFAALELIERGYKPIIFERGEKIEDRDASVAQFINHKLLNPQSNVQFGEGGAGAYSDGKLFSRMHKNIPQIQKVLDTFVRFGAPKKTANTFKPHLGTDVIRVIVKNIREYILENGGEIHFGSQMTDLVIKDGSISGIVVNGRTEYPATIVFLAIGHSARDTFSMLKRNNVHLEQKPILVGLRIDHPVEIIDLIRYEDKYDELIKNGPAPYSLNFTDKKTKRQVVTFCMCPGGEIVNASSEEGHLVTNGMSYAARNGAYSNSAIVVSCKTEDYQSIDPLAGIEFQKKIEHQAYLAGGENGDFPAQNLLDFMEGTLSSEIGPTSFKTGIKSVNLKTLFPEYIWQHLIAAFTEWQKGYPLFISRLGVLVAPETRTTCPVTIKRDSAFCSVNVKGLIPIGEGSGYSGGISSSAADAIKAVETIV
jgi:uncharacterized FAD-dependent dehydrogenase